MIAPLLHPQMQPLLADLEKLNCNDRGIVEIGWLELSRMISELRLLIDLASAQDLELQVLRLLERDRLAKLDLEAMATQTMAELAASKPKLKLGEVVAFINPKPADQSGKGGEA